MTTFEERFGLFWAILGPVISILLVVKVYFKADQPRSILGRYSSFDACIYYQIWTHVFGSITHSILTVPFIHDFLSCSVRKWAFIFFITLSLFSHVPSILDCALRTNDTPFYEQYHSRSPYNHLLMIVLCTWTPFFHIWLFNQEYFANEFEPIRYGCKIVHL